MPERKTTRIHNIDDLVAQATAKAKEPIPCFIVISGKSAGRLYKLASELAMIGRGTDATIYIDDDSISRFHAQVRKTASGIVVEDLDSTNGTFFNGEKRPLTCFRTGTRSRSDRRRSSSSDMPTGSRKSSTATSTNPRPATR